ncbi:MAG: hypothetical protein AUG80_04765 [Candidatus Rokubacteria bacterium 13_1_20CM_4_68_9]|nr:MAG: hypothetical protein AUG80_04765 [Candidatus Rokubacteria bacterium 13_1_20CM_4_68_9]
MATVEFDAGARRQAITLPDGATVLEYVEQPATGEPGALVDRALDAPLGLPPLRELAATLPRGGRRVVIAFDDPNRPLATIRAVLPAVLGRLNAAGVGDEDITLVSANGMHPKFSREAFAAYLGPDVLERFGGRVRNHDCEDVDDLVDLGATEFGDVVQVNRHAVESDLLIYVGNVAVNIWGGYSGTGSVVGLAGVRGFAGHHGRHGIGHPDSCHGDPHAMLYQRRKRAVAAVIDRARPRPVLYVEAMTDGRGVVDVFAGTSDRIRAAAWPEADRRFVRPAAPADVVIVGLAPAFLYGPAHNPLIALTGVCFPLRLWRGQPLLRPGGVVIGVTDSLGVVDAATHPGYEEAIAEFGVARSFETVAKAGSRIGGDAALVARYRAGSAYHPWHPFWLFAEDEYGMTRAGAIIMAGARPGMLWQQLGCVVAATPSDALAQARGLVGAEARIVALPTYWSKPRIAFQVG